MITTGKQLAKTDKLVEKVEKAFKTPAYNKDLSYGDRLWDFLGKYHITLNGVQLHEPFMLVHEGMPNRRCDDDDKEDIVAFVHLLLGEVREKK